MKKRTQLLLVLSFILFISTIEAQYISQLNNIDVSNLLDKQIKLYWNSIQKNSYTMDQFETIAKAQCTSSLKIAEFKKSINNLDTFSNQKEIKNNILDKVKTYDFAYCIYSELAKQLETQKIKVKDVPTFLIIKKVFVPLDKLSQEDLGLLKF
tara:strand:- start:9118 stop:9576 length:459 start_codon:yes stop_codon:yes gene_type:complete